MLSPGLANSELGLYPPCERHPKQTCKWAISGIVVLIGHGIISIIHSYYVRKPHGGYSLRLTYPPSTPVMGRGFAGKVMERNRGLSIARHTSRKSGYPLYFYGSQFQDTPHRFSANFKWANRPITTQWLDTFPWVFLTWATPNFHSNVMFPMSKGNGNDHQINPLSHYIQIISLERYPLTQFSARQFMQCCILYNLQCHYHD